MQSAFPDRQDQKHPECGRTEQGERFGHEPVEYPPCSRRHEVCEGARIDPAGVIIVLQVGISSPARRLPLIAQRGHIADDASPQEADGRPNEPPYASLRRFRLDPFDGEGPQRREPEEKQAVLEQRPDEQGRAEEKTGLLHVTDVSQQTGHHECGDERIDGIFPSVLGLPYQSDGNRREQAGEERGPSADAGPGQQQQKHGHGENACAGRDHADAEGRAFELLDRMEDQGIEYG